MGFLSAFFSKKETSKQSSKKSSQKAYASIKKNFDFIQTTLHHSDDLQMRKLDDESAIIYFNTLTDTKLVHDRIMSADTRTITGVDLAESEIETTDDLNNAVSALIDGYTVLCKNGSQRLYLVNTTAHYDRQIDEPDNEKIIRGAHNGFNENLKTNINLLRKSIESPDLCVNYYRIGNMTRKKTAMIYMKGIANPAIINAVEERLRTINVDMVMSPGFIEEFIENSSFSPFPQALGTERPDRTMGNLMEGRIVLMTEGAPTALILPVTFFAFYQSPDDYNNRAISGTFTRILRIFSFMVAIVLPSFYIAVAGHNFEVIPDELVLPLKTSVNEIPYPPLFEALVMVLTIELIREAGIRLPTPVGQTIGIVGGLVIGNAVVMAGLISNIMIVIIAVTAISSFVVPSNEMSNAVRILTFPLIFMSSMFGFVGIMFSLLFLLIHLCKLESFGTAYFAPVAPLNIRNLKDSIIRLPLWMHNKRPRDAQPEQLQTQKRSRKWDK
ncbi:MAG TPA: spore germination protein [Bacillales bacterium]|nr:spore germination protein [Bacillales bacterium]